VECEAKGRGITERPPEKAFRRAQGVELRTATKERKKKATRNGWRRTKETEMAAALGRRAVSLCRSV